MPVTLKDIAKRAHVTSATVSMVINHKPNISQKTRDKVLAIAHEMNYYPNVIARGLAIRKSNSIGVIVPNLASSYVVRILQGIKSTNKDINYTVQLFDTIGQKETESQLFQRLARERRIDGAIIIDSSCSEKKLKVFNEESVPCILVAQKCDIMDSVFVNNKQGAREAIDFLISKKHRKIACVTCSKKNLPIKERLDGYKQSLNLNKIPFNDKLIFGVKDDTMADGESVFSKIIKSPYKPTAVFVPAGDFVAIGIIKMAKRTGLNIPEDLAVVGFDDLPAAEVIEPTLTTVRQPKLEMGDNAIDLIIEKIENPTSTIKHKELLTKLIIRNST